MFNRGRPRLAKHAANKHMETPAADDPFLSPLSERPTVTVNTKEINAFTTEWEFGACSDGVPCVAIKGVRKDGDALIIARTPTPIFAKYLVMIQDIALEVGGRQTIPMDRDTIAAAHHYQYCMERPTCKGLPDFAEEDYDYADKLIEMWGLYHEKVVEPTDVAMQPMAHGEASLQAPWPHDERDRDV